MPPATGQLARERLVSIIELISQTDYKLSVQQLLLVTGKLALFIQVFAQLAIAATATE